MAPGDPDRAPRPCALGPRRPYVLKRRNGEATVLEVAPEWDANRGTTTPQDLLLPEGKLIRTTRGGANALKQLLLDLKKYSFSGYVRTVREAGGTRSEGIVLLRRGNPEASLYQRGGPRGPGHAPSNR